MYTRCPSCRSEISFEAPANINNLPDGYKHRIKCPNCGVTIGVKIPRQEAYLQAQPTYTPQYPQATSYEPVYQAAPVAAAPAKAEKAAKVKADKKSGRGRNFVILLLSLAFVALSVVGYLIANGTLADVPAWAQSISLFGGISLLANAEALGALFEASIAVGIVTILPLILFLVAALNAVVAFIALIGGKYGRAWNLISGLILAACAICMMFQLLLLMLAGGAEVPAEGVVEYFTSLIEGQQYFAFVSAGLGVLQLLFSLIFLKSLKRKAN